MTRKTLPDKKKPREKHVDWKSSRLSLHKVEEISEAPPPRPQRLGR